MLFFGKKEKEVEELVTKHMQLVKQALTEFSNLIDAYIEGDKQFEEDAYTIHKLEHKADVARRQVAIKLSEGAFLPIYREDYIVLLELIDKIANKVESTSDYLVLTRPDIPEFLVDEIRNLVRSTLGCFEPIESLYELFQKDFDQVLAMAKSVEEKEQEVDKIQWYVVKGIFKSDLPLAEKLVLKGLVDNIAAISDRMEDVSDRFEIMVVKRSI